MLFFFYLNYTCLLINLFFENFNNLPAEDEENMGEYSRADEGAWRYKISLANLLHLPPCNS